MAVSTMEVIMPQMGESITEATITGWRKAVGDQVEEGEALLDISTAKVEVEIPSPHSGVIAELLFAKDDTVPIDTVIARLAPKGTDVSALGGASKKAAPKEKDASPAPAAAARAGTPKHARPANGNGSSTDNDSIERERQHLIRRRSTPLVRNMAADLNIDIEEVPGSGAHGRVTRRDLEAYLEQRQHRARTHHGVGGERHAVPEPERLRIETVSGPGSSPVVMQPDEVPVSNMRRLIAQQMVKSKQTIPHAYTVHEVDFTRLERVRARQRNLFEQQFSTKLTPLVFVLKAVCDALLKHPKVNASWRDDKIIMHKHVNLGVAVAVPAGLMVPVLKHVESMSLAGIARGVVDLAIRGRDNKLLPADMEGGTFTITSPGKLGATMGIPVINHPQGAILHVGAIQKIPAVVTGPDGEDVIAIRQRAMLTLGLDHRLIDGWDADQFMADLRDIIERAEFGLAS